MPRFNKNADWAAGLGGDRVAMIVNGVQVNDGPGGAGDWLNDEEITSTRWSSFEDFRASAINKAGQERVLSHGVFNAVFSGGNRWGTLGTNGNRADLYFLDNGQKTLPIIGFGPDGSLATVLQGEAATGLVLNGKTLTTALVWDVTVFGAGRALWREADGPHAIGVPVPTLLPGRSYGLRAAYDGTQWWVLYQASEYNGQLVLHPFNSFTGYALTAPGGNAFRSDVVALGGALHIIWATVESEQLGQIAGPYVPQHEGFPLVDLSQKATQAPPPTPQPIAQPPQITMMYGPASGVAPLSVKSVWRAEAGSGEITSVQWLWRRAGTSAWQLSVENPASDNDHHYTFEVGDYEIAARALGPGGTAQTGARRPVTVTNALLTPAPAPPVPEQPPDLKGPDNPSVPEEHPKPPVQPGKVGIWSAFFGWLFKRLGF